MAGRYFEELTPGLVIRHNLGRTITEMDNVLFSALTMNTQPLHLNEDFAQKHSPFGRRVVNGIFTLGLAVGISVGSALLHAPSIAIHSANPKLEISLRGRED